MLLNDIGKSPSTTFTKINQHLETNYGFKIAEDISDRDLVAIMEQIEEEITDLKIKGDNSKASPEISKRLLVLEGIKTLREFAILQFQSPDLENVINGMINYVTEHFRLSGNNYSDFNRAMQRVMEEYRSSKYRFPDDFIEQRVRQGALSKIQSMSDKEPNIESDGIKLDHESMLEDDTITFEDKEMRTTEIKEEDPWQSVGKRASAMGGHAPTDLSHGQKQVLGKLGFAPEPEEEPVPMIRDKNGRMVPDPFEVQKRQRMKGIKSAYEGKMMEQKENLVKNLRRLLETEVSQAEVMMAAKGFAQELQEMIEKIGRLQNEDLPPVTDQMRETYGTDSSSAFQTQIYGALQGVMDSLYTAKGQVDDAVSNMAATGKFDAQTDMDLPIDSDNMGEPSAMNAHAGDEADLDNLAGDLEAEDEFGGAEEEEPLGRAMKTESLQRRVVEMKKLVERARKLREARA